MLTFQGLSGTHEGRPGIATPGEVEALGFTEAGVVTWPGEAGLLLGLKTPLPAGQQLAASPVDKTKSVADAQRKASFEALGEGN